MSSRRHDSEDSLDLLLDPICNIFGTVMFVALIVAILALTRSGVETLDTLDSFSREDESKLGQLQVRAEELESLLSTLPASEGEELDDAAAAQIERAIGEVAHRQEVVNRYRTVVAATRENLGEVSVLLPPLREEVSRVSDALESARRAKDRQLRTPLEREVALFPFTMLVWHDRLYVLCDLTTRPRDGCEWLRCWDPKYVVAARCSTPVFECSRVKIYIERSVFLRENAGINLVDVGTLRNDSAFIALLATLRPTEDLVSLVVAPDSFDSFAIVKEAMLAAGFTYTVEPCDQDLPNYRDVWIPGNPRGL